MSRILIGGCSFTQSRVDERKEWLDSDRSWKPYSDLLLEEYGNIHEITNVGKCSSGNGVISDRIINELFKSNFSYNLVIVQWSAVLRGFAFDEKHFVGRVGGLGMQELWPHIEEYVFENKLPYQEVTNEINIIENKFYLHTLFIIYSLQKVLESNNIKYFMFWGWEQINDVLYQDYKNVFDKIYNDSFWRFNNNGGLNEYAISLIGKNDALIPNDFHPTSKSHKLFYENIINPYLKTIL